MVLAISFLRVPESRDDGESKSLDWLGSGLGTLGLGTLVYGLIESSRFGFGHPLVIGTSGSWRALAGDLSAGRGACPQPDVAADIVSFA